MALHSDYEPVRASLLHRETFLKLESAVAELLSEETRLGILRKSQLKFAGHQVILAASSNGRHYEKTCNYCKRSGHVISECQKSQAKQKKELGKHSKSYSHASAVVTDPPPTTETISSYSKSDD